MRIGSISIKDANSVGGHQIEPEQTPTSSQRPDVYLGAINFVGGWPGEGCGDYLDVNRTLFVRGASFPDDTLWLYANNDTFYSVEHSQANFDAFTSAGGLGDFNVYTRAPGLNGHFLTNDPQLWGADVQAYLAMLPWRRFNCIKNNGASLHDG